MSKLFWPDDELSFKEQWAIGMKHLRSLSYADQVKAISASQTFVRWSASGVAIGLGLGCDGVSKRKDVCKDSFGRQIAIVCNWHIIQGAPLIRVAVTNVYVVSGATTAGACFGMLFGIRVADRKLRKDMESRDRMALAWKRARAETYRKAAEHLETTLSDSGSVDP
ncbi:MAG: hypothetical protein Q9192_005748 [Flavoplaca navasiana]